MRLCPICGKRVLRKSKKAIYCSDKCSTKAYRMRNPQKIKESQDKYNLENHNRRLETYRRYRIRSGRSKTIWHENLYNTCLECGKKFHPPKTVPFKKYCSPLCRSRYISRKWNKKNPEKLKEYMSKYDKSEKRKESIKRNSVKRKEYQKLWRANNPEKSAKYSKEYKESNPEKRRLQYKKYKKSIKGILANRKRSHITRMLEKSNYNHNKLIPILIEQNNKCPICGLDYGENFENMELGHIYSLKRYPELASHVKNIIPICKTCNRRMRTSRMDKYCKKFGYEVPIRVKTLVEKIGNPKKLLDYK
jgi:endogenous inhibitor of DNA gyrase (YacG/DUF329 family)